MKAFNEAKKGSIRCHSASDYMKETIKKFDQSQDAILGADNRPFTI